VYVIRSITNVPPRVPRSIGLQGAYGVYVCGAHAVVSDTSFELGDGPTLLFATTE
jgi:hypothetical protein